MYTLSIVLGVIAILCSIGFGGFSKNEEVPTNDPLADLLEKTEEKEPKLENEPEIVHEKPVDLVEKPKKVAAKKSVAKKAAAKKSAPKKSTSTKKSTENK